MKTKLFQTLLICLFILSSVSIYAQYKTEPVIEKDGRFYLSNTIVYKLKNSELLKRASAMYLPPDAVQGIKDFKIVGLKKRFERISNNDDILNSIVEIKYSSKEDPEKIADIMKQSGAVEWAEPHYVYMPEYTPDDEMYPDQWNLQKISAERAWDITKGDKKVIIAIVDSGVDWDHPDLSERIWQNPDEIPDNGIDDDKNNYVDDVRGWDFGGLHDVADNNPMEDQPDHGTHVAGIAGAVSDNSEGVASIGYSVTILPVKVTVDDLRSPNNGPYIIYGFEGIVYAADNGASIINCSWGGSGYSDAGQAAVDYAISKGALVVTAAGNNASGELYYPACYEGVLSVAATDIADIKSSFSNYGEYIGVSAPGSSIKSTWQDNTYEKMNGTSMAAPLAAGLAGLVKSIYPDYTPLQIAEQIRINSDNIDALNPGYEYMLGNGRINAYKTISNKNTVGARAYEMISADDNQNANNNGVYEPGEIITIGFNFLNILNPIKNMKVILESADTNIIILNNVYNAAGIMTSEYFNNYSSPFRIKIKEYVPENYEISFILKYSSEENYAFQKQKLTVNQTYQTISNGKIELTVASKGNIGFNDFWENTQGIGFRYNGSNNLLYEGAFLAGTSPAGISDAARGISDPDSDFHMIRPFEILKNTGIADAEGITIFNDDGAGDSKLRIETILSTYSWEKEQDNNFIILRYRLVNNNKYQLNTLYAGLYLDWNMLNSDATGDVAAFSVNESLGYAFCMNSEKRLFAGCALLNEPGCNFYAISNNGGDGGIGVYAGSGGFTNEEKWITLSSGIKKTKAENADVSFVISGGPYDIDSGDTLNVAFAITAANNLSELRENAIRAKEKYKTIFSGISSVESADDLLPKKFELEQNYPNPFNPVTTIRIHLPYDVNAEVKLYDILGREVKVLFGGRMDAGIHEVILDGSELASGTYIYRLMAGGYTCSKKLVLIK